MPSYTVKDPSGRSITLTGDTPPSEQDIDQVFSSMPKPNSRLQQGMNPMGFLGNLIRSGVGQAGNVMQAVRDPVGTAMNIGKLGIGAAENGSNALLHTQFNDGNTQLANNVGQTYAQRYGGVNNTLNTLYNDPAGAAMDASTFLDGLGLAGDVSKVGTLSKMGKVGDAINPLSMMTKPVTAIADKVGIGSPLAPFAKSYQPDVAANAKELGVDLPVSGLTNNKMLQGSEALTSKLPFGQGITNTINTAGEKLNNLASNITNKLNTVPDLIGAGQAVKNGFQNFVDTFNDQKNQLYNAIPKETYTAPAYTTQTSKTLQNIINQKGQSLAGDNNVGLYQNIQNNIPRVDGQGNIVGTPPTIAQLRQTLSEVGSKLKNKSDPIAVQDQGHLKQLYGALSQDIDHSISQVNPEAGKALQQATGYYNQGINKIRSPLGKLISNSDPEKIPDLLLKPNSQTQISHVKEIVGDDAFKSLQDNFLASLYHKSLDNNGVLDVGKLKQTMGKYQSGTLDQLLRPDQLKELENVNTNMGKINNVKESLARGTKNTNGSQTAFNASTLGEGAALFLHPMTALKILGANYGMSKLFTSPVGKTYLTSGIPLNPTLAKTINVASKGIKNGAMKGAMYNNPLYQYQQSQP